MTKLSKVSRTGLLFYVASILFLAAITLILPSCTKDPGKIGTIIQPGDSWLKVRFTDTTSIVAYSIIDDSVRTDELTRNAIGYVNDPVFGATKASFYTQFVLSTNGHNFGEEPHLDSLVLQLVYSGAYADTNTTITVHTYEMLKGIYKDSAYYSPRSFEVGNTDFSDYSFVPRPHDSVYFLGDTLPALIRINLSDLSTELGERLLSADSATDMVDNEAFLEFFKGLYLTPSAISSTGSLAYFNLISGGSKLSIYYSNQEDDSLRYDFIISSSAARFNKYEHDFTNASVDLRQQIVNGDSALGEQNFYIQGYAGVKTVIKLPYPKSWRNLVNVAVNEAKLTFPGGNFAQFYEAPAQLVLVQRLQDGSYELLPDYNDGVSYFGGTYEAESNRYVFRITKYIQSIISDSTTVNYGLYLLVNAGSINPESFIFNGFKPNVDTADRMKLEILYTDLD